MKRAWQIGNILTLVFALVANFLVGAQVLDVPSIGQVSDRYATLLTPASYAFSIWSVIYVLLVIFVIYQARDLFRPSADNQLPQRVGPWFIVANICNGLWTYVFVSGLVGLSVIILLLLTASLYILLGRLRIAIDNPPAITIACVWWPLLLYAGWVTVASVVNMASWLESLGVTPNALSANIILVSLTVSLLVLLVTRNVRELLLAAIWGILAIGIQQLAPGGDEMVSTTALISSGILLGAVIVHAYIYKESNAFAKLVKK